jgi:hypothetical protein
VPMINNIGIATMSPTDHLPNVVFGVILQDCIFILSSFDRSLWLRGLLFGWMGRHLLFPSI